MILTQAELIKILSHIRKETRNKAAKRTNNWIIYLIIWGWFLCVFYAGLCWIRNSNRQRAEETTSEKVKVDAPASHSQLFYKLNQEDYK